MTQRFEIDLGPGSAMRPGLRPDRPMRILILGDFSARSRGPAAEASSAGGRRRFEVDGESLERVLARIAPRLELSSDDEASTYPVEFEKFADFEPDVLCERVAGLRSLLRTRERLLDPATFELAAGELRRELRPADKPERGKPAAAPGSGDEPEGEGSMFERLLGRPQLGPEAASPGRAGIDISDFVRDIVGPHLVRDVQPQQRQIVELFDRGLASATRQVLHHPDFKALEASWRGIQWLVRQLETGERVRLYVIDVSKSELAHELCPPGGGSGRSWLDRELGGGESDAPDGASWSLVVGDYYFDDTEDDCRLLQALGTMARRTGGPFVAAARPAILGCPALHRSPDPEDWGEREPEAVARWEALRRSPVAPWIGLVLPRFMLRLPYGKETHPIERFAFEELPPERPHEGYLWGNPAYVAAMLLGRAFNEAGGATDLEDPMQVDGLPAHSFEEDGEWQMISCAETYLSDSSAEAILGMGIMPLLGFKHRDAARLAGPRSLADPPKRLAGPW